MSSHKKSGVRLWWFLVPVAVVLGWGTVYGKWFEKEAKVEIRGAKVEKGRLAISVLQRGNLAAKDAVSVKSEIEGQTTILWLIQEGTFVKPNDLLVELDTSDLVEKKVAQEISVQNAEASYTKARASYDIQESQNKSDIEAAERKLTFAEIDRRKYLEGDFEQQKKAADEKIALAEAELLKGKNTYEWSKNLSDRGFLTKTELDRDELDYQRGKITLEQAKRAKDLLVQFDDPRKRTEIEANFKEAERGLERAKLQAASRLVDFESALVTSKSKLDLEREKLQKYKDQIAKGRIVAKDSGMVVFTRSEGGRMGGGDPIQEGTQVRERQEILTIPRTNGLIVEASVHESVLKRVEVGNACTIKVDALPGKEFTGTVQFVALLPDKASWWANPNQRLYRTEIAVTNPIPEMRPGMSCSLEVLAETVEDCLQVPLQAIVMDKGKTTAFVVRGKNYEQRDVVVGRSNDAKVEVISGLAVGDEVLLSPPVGFTPQGAETKASDAKPGGAAAMRPDGAPGGAPSMRGEGAPMMRGGDGTMPANVPAGANGGERNGGAPGAGGSGRGGGMRPDGAPRGGGKRPKPGDGSGAAPAGDKAPGGGAPAGGEAPTPKSSDAPTKPGSGGARE